MLRLSKKSDYALIAMKHLALRSDRGSSSAREIAALYDIPIELMAKVLQRLVRRGLLASQQGTRGGLGAMRPTFADGSGNAASGTHRSEWEAEERVRKAGRQGAVSIGRTRRRSSSPAARPSRTISRSKASPRCIARKATTSSPA